MLDLTNQCLVHPLLGVYMSDRAYIGSWDGSETKSWCLPGDSCHLDWVTIRGRAGCIGNALHSQGWTAVEMIGDNQYRLVRCSRCGQTEWHLLSDYCWDRPPYFATELNQAYACASQAGHLKGPYHYHPPQPYGGKKE